MKKIIKKFLNSVIKFAPINNNRIIFETGLGLADDNPRALFDYMFERANFDCFFIVDKNTNIQGLPKESIVMRNSLKYVWLKATTKVIVYSQSLGSIIDKRKEQFYIQLWHGPEFKVEGYNIKNDIPIINRVPMKHTNEWDVFVSLNKRDSELMSTATGYNGEVIDMGLPRFDSIHNLNVMKKSNNSVFLEEENKIRNKISALYEWRIDDEEKIFLYAPTFRDWELEQNDSSFVESEDFIVKLISTFNSLKKGYLLIKLHPLQNNERIKSVTYNLKNVEVIDDQFKNIELFLGCDCLITDYSSIFYDYSILEKPIIWFPYDYAQYKKLRGGLYYSYDQLPGLVVNTFSEFITACEEIYKGNEALFMKNNKKYLDQFHYNTDGKACFRLTNYIKMKVEGSLNAKNT